MSFRRTCLEPSTTWHNIGMFLDLFPRFATRAAAALCALLLLGAAPAIRAAPPGGMLKVGDRAPEFTLKTLDGVPVSLAALLRRGPVLLNFYSLDCKFCGDELPHLQETFVRYRKAGLSVASVNVGYEDTTEGIRRLWNAKGLTFPCLRDER